MDLLELRNKLDGIDSEIVRLYEERMEVCGKVADYKIQTGKKVFDNSLQNLKSTLGNKKIVSLSLAKPFKEEKIGNAFDGISVIPGNNSHEISLEVDLDKQEIREFLGSLNGVVDFMDISIKELPMETIITRIYSE